MHAGLDTSFSLMPSAWVSKSLLTENMNEEGYGSCTNRHRWAVQRPNTGGVLYSGQEMG